MWRPWVRRTASVVAAAAAVLILDLLYAATTYAFSMRASARHVRAAVAALGDSDAVAAAGHLALAETAADLAEVRAARPSLSVLDPFGLQADLDALVVVADALSDLAASAQGTVLAALENGAVERGLFGAFYEDGAVDLDALVDLRRGIGDLRLDVIDIHERVAAIDAPALPPVRNAVARLERRLTKAEPDLTRALMTTELLPRLLGGDGPRRYLLAFQSPSEARGGGGLIGVYGVLTADDGRLDLGHVGPIEELVGARSESPGRGSRPRGPEGRGRITAPGWYRGLYGGFLGLEDIRHANLTPSFPVSSDIWLQMYEAATGDELDGVIALDPLAVGEITRGTGPLRAPGWDRTIDRFSARRVLLHDIYRHFDLKERKQNEYLRGLIDELWSRLETGDVRAAGLARGLAAAVSEQHLKVFVPEPGVAALLNELEMNGDYRAAGPNVQLVFHNNFAANKIDFFIKRTASTELVMEDDGDVSAVTEVEIANEAPDDRSVLVRPLRRDLPMGISRMTLSFLLPEGAEPRRLTLDGRDSNFFSGREYDYPVAWQILDVGAGETQTVRLRWTWPDAWSHDPNGPDLELTPWPQALVRPDFATLAVTPPPGYELASDPPGEFRHRPPRTFAIDLVPSH